NTIEALSKGSRVPCDRHDGGETGRCPWWLNNTVGADLSRTSPIDRPSVHVPLSQLFCETSLSALAACPALPTILLTFIIALKAVECCARQGSRRQKYVDEIDCEAHRCLKSMIRL